MPLVSVVCPAYNRGPAIRATIDSVLAQSCTDLELVVVSDGSTDDTDAQVREASRSDRRVRLVTIDHVGNPSPALNVGTASVEGAVIAHVDHDDLWTPDHLRTLLDQVERGADIVATGSVWIDPAGEVLSVRPAASLLWHPDIQAVNPVFETSQAAYRAEWAERVGAWGESAHGLEDWDMWLRFADAGARFQTVQHPTVKKTMGIGNRHRRLPPAAHGMLLATFPDAPRARRALAALHGRTVVEELTAAGAADMLEWYRRLARDEAFVFPVGFAADRESAIAGLPASLAVAREGGSDDPVIIRLAPRDGGVALVQDVNCLRAEHADRYAAVTRAAQPRLLEIIGRVAARFDGLVPAPATGEPRPGP